MSRKGTVNHEMLSAVNAASAQTSNSTNVEHLDKASIHCKFSSASSGTFVVQARNGVYRPDQVEDNWYDLQFGQPLAISGETDVQFFLTEMSFSEIRIKWLGGGSGLLTAKLNTKVVGS